MVAFEAFLAHMRRNLDEFLYQFVTVDETWIHHYTPETKEQSKQWIVRGKLSPKKVKTVKSADKVRAQCSGMRVLLSSLIIWNEEKRSQDNIMRRCWAS